VIQPQLNNHSDVSDAQAIAPTPQNSASATTVIQPQLDNHQSVPSPQAISTPQNSTPETTVIQPQLNNHSDVSDAQAIAPTPQNSASETTVIQPQLDNHRSVSSSQAIAPTTQNSGSETTVIQAQLDNHRSVSSSQAIAPTPQNSASETTVIQPQLDNHPDVPDSQAIALNTTNNFVPEITVIQPQLDNHQAVHLPNINSLLDISQNKTISNTDSTVNSSNIKTNIHNITPIEITDETKNIQPKNAEIPALPKVLKNISILTPLSQQSELIKSNVVENTSQNATNTLSINHISQHKIQKAPIEDLPDSWSSITELIDEMSTINHREKVTIQPQKDEKEWHKVLPNQTKRSPNLGKNITHKIKSQPKIDFSTKNNSHHQLIQTFANSADLTIIQKTDDLPSQQPANNNLTKDEIENLEILAQEIYKILQQRLEIDRERRGNNYSGRLPW
ncbi:MAG TPA: hypothetical protein IGS40_07915, partial [Trichormus sp. M33_DOE_039]|nr:hypothetical protein [Trichormus sp. M33_DOE_039]